MKKPKTALIISTVYLLLVLLSFVIMLVTLDSTPMAGVFLIMLTPPWPTILGMLEPNLSSSSALINGLILVAGGVLNGLLLYFLCSKLAYLLKR